MKQQCGLRENELSLFEDRQKQSNHHQQLEELKELQQSIGKKELLWARKTQLSHSLVWHLSLKMRIVSTNPASAMKLHSELFCIMIY